METTVGDPPTASNKELDAVSGAQMALHVFPTAVYSIGYNPGELNFRLQLPVGERIGREVVELVSQPVTDPPEKKAGSEAE